MDALQTRPLRNTGPIELRDLGPRGRRLGTEADCYDGSRWELHRGELVEEIAGGVIHGIAMSIVNGLLRTHARPGCTTMIEVYCDLSDQEGASLRVPDVVLVDDLKQPRNDAYRGTPVLAVEIRGTQPKAYLEEKLKLYLEHDWPRIWIVHPERREVQVLRPGTTSVTYGSDSEVPLPTELDKYGLRAVPVAAFFDRQDANRYTVEWVQARGEARGRAASIASVLAARGIAVPDAVRARIGRTTDLALLERWLNVAATCASAEAFADALG